VSLTILGVREDSYCEGGSYGKLEGDLY